MNQETLEVLGRIGTATITMQLLKRGLRNATMRGVRPLHGGVGTMAGEAFTLRYVPLREDLSQPEILGRADYAPRVAIETAPKGSVLVVDARGLGDTAVIGDILAYRLKDRGVAGLVSDGGVRDAAAVTAIGFPVFCSGPAAPASISGLSAADVQTPIGCGGVAVLPGDAIVGDGDGVVVVPAALAGEVARDGAEQARLESFVEEKVRQGRPVIGLYPPDAETRAEYEAWVRDGKAKD
jgi:regulator of RNase E activity RraA